MPTTGRSNPPPPYLRLKVDYIRKHGQILQPCDGGLYIVKIPAVTSMPPRQDWLHCHDMWTGTTQPSTAFGKDDETRSTIERCLGWSEVDPRHMEAWLELLQDGDLPRMNHMTIVVRPVLSFHVGRGLAGFLPRGATRLLPAVACPCCVHERAPAQPVEERSPGFAPLRYCCSPPPKSPNSQYST